MVAILGLGFASWGLGMERRGSGEEAVAYPGLVQGEGEVRKIFVAYVVVVVAASTSVTLEAFLCWVGVRRNGGGVSLIFSYAVSSFVLTNVIRTPHALRKLSPL